MELVKKLKTKKNRPKQQESKLSIFSFICALMTLALFNLFLMNRNEIETVPVLLYKGLPILGIGSAILSFFRFNYKKHLAAWSIFLFAFIFVSFIIMFFFEYVIYPKP